jgi:hypothetical protein
MKDQINIVRKSGCSNARQVVKNIIVIFQPIPFEVIKDFEISSVLLTERNILDQNQKESCKVFFVEGDREIVREITAHHRLTFALLMEENGEYVIPYANEYSKVEKLEAIVGRKPSFGILAEDLLDRLEAAGAMIWESLSPNLHSKKVIGHSVEIINDDILNILINEGKENQILSYFSW